MALENSNHNTESYKLMMGGAHQLISSDTKQLAETKAYTTNDWFKAKAQVESYQHVLAMAVGKYHPITKAYVAAVK